MSVFGKSIKFGKSIFTGSIFVILCLANFAYSQVTTGQIAGVVTDPNGAVVAGRKRQSNQYGNQFSRVKRRRTDKAFIHFSNFRPDVIRSRLRRAASGLVKAEAVVNITQTTNVDAHARHWRR